MTIQTMTLGYARMGKRREVKRALESFWNRLCLEEVVLALKNMVVAAQTLREEIYATSY